MKKTRCWMAWPPSVSRTVVCPARSKSDKSLMVSSCACRNGSFDGATIGTPWTEWMPRNVREWQQTKSRGRESMRGFRIYLALALSCAAWGPARAEISGDVVRVGVLNDISGIFQDTNGMGSVEAGRMAAEDFNGGARNIKVEIVYADHQNKADVGSAIARKWLDVDGVDAIVDVPNSAVGLTINSLVRDSRMTFLASSTASSDLTGKACSPNTIQWVNDAWATGNTTAAAMMARGGKDWYFVTVNYALGQGIEAEATNYIEKHGGKVLGSAKHPLGTSDFASFLLQAQNSKAKVIGLANAGGDTINGKMPSGNQAGVYASTLAYLNAVAATGSDAAKDVVPQMKKFKGKDKLFA